MHYVGYHRSVCVVTCRATPVATDNRRRFYLASRRIHHQQAPSLTLSLSYREQQNANANPRLMRGSRRLDGLQSNDRLVGSQVVVFAVALSFPGHH
jgi:hypothetical protein